MLDRIEAERTEMQGLRHRRMQIGEVEAFQQPQNLHVLAPAVLVHPRLHQAAQRGELDGQVPALERSSLIQRVDLLLDQRQVMQRSEADVFAFPAKNGSAE